MRLRLISVLKNQFVICTILSCFFLTSFVIIISDEVKIKQLIYSGWSKLSRSIVR